MRPIFIVLIAAALCSTSAYAQKKTTEIPTGIKASAAKKYPNATGIIWERENGKYETSFTDKGKKMSVLYDTDGRLEETETEIVIAELPAAARKYAERMGKIKEAAKIVLASGKVQYEAEVKNKDILFDDQGHLLQEKTEKDEGKD